MMKTKYAFALPLIAALCAGQSAYSYEAGQWLVRGGATTVDPKSDSDGLQINNGAPLADEVRVGDDTQLGVAIAYMLSSNVAVELLLATPFKHDIYGKGSTLSSLGIDKVGSTKHLPPTLTLQYYPLDAKSPVQPYVGLGVNYTRFFSEDTSSAVDSNFAGADLELDDSTGFAVQLGVDFAIDEHWFANVSVWRVDIDTDAKIKFDGGVLNVDDVKIDPWVYNIGIGYAF
jgi:outer membrane protein